MNRNLIIRAVVIAFALVATAAIVIDWNAIAWHSLDQSTNDAQLRGDLTRIEDRVAGYITRVAVNDFQPVHKGQLLYQIEDDDYRTRLEQAQPGQAQAQLPRSAWPRPRSQRPRRTRQAPRLPCCGQSRRSSAKPAC